MNCIPIRTRALVAPKDDLFEALSVVPKLSERVIICVASKVVAIHQGRTLPISEVSGREELIAREATYAIPKSLSPGEHVTLTVTDGMIISSAGIDKSNANDHYILWPKDCHAFAWKLRDFFRQRDGVKDLGVIIVDSHSLPMRRGSMGFSLGFAGFAPLNSYVGKPDIFGKTMTVSVVNLVDGIASAGAFVMGEGDEQTPVAIVSDLPNVIFDEADHSTEVVVPLEQDIYYPLTKNFLEFPVNNQFDQ